MQRAREVITKDDAVGHCKGLIDTMHRTADKFEGIDFLASVLVRAASGRVREALERLLAHPGQGTTYGIMEKERSQSLMGELADAAPFFETDHAITRKRKLRAQRKRKRA